MPDAQEYSRIAITYVSDEVVAHMYHVSDELASFYFVLARDFESRVRHDFTGSGPYPTVVLLLLFLTATEPSVKPKTIAPAIAASAIPPSKSKSTHGQFVCAMRAVR